VSFLLDTNVVSEIRKKAPDPGVSAWFASVPDDELFLSVLVVGEIRQASRDSPGETRLKLRSSNSGSADWFTPMTTASSRSPPAWPRHGGVSTSLTPCQSLTA
jgi:predicted nucleic acid-binding protein